MNKFENLTQVDIQNTIDDLNNLIYKELKQENIDTTLVAKYCLQREELSFEKFTTFTLEELSREINRVTESNKTLYEHLANTKFTQDAIEVIKLICDKDFTMLVEMYHKRAKLEPPDDKVKTVKAIKKKPNEK